jgi:hypothetical protein
MRAEFSNLGWIILAFDRTLAAIIFQQLGFEIEFGVATLVVIPRPGSIQ